MLEAEKLKGQNRLEEGIKALQDKLAAVAEKVEKGGGGAAGGGGAGGGGGGGAAGGGGGGAMAPAMAASQQNIANKVGLLGETVSKLTDEVQGMKTSSNMWAAAGGKASTSTAGGATGDSAAGAVIGQMAGSALGSALKAVEGVSQASQLLHSANIAAGAAGGGLAAGGIGGGGIVGLIPGAVLANGGAGVGAGAGVGMGVLGATGLGILGAGGGGAGVGGGGGGGSASIIGGSSLAADNDNFAGSEMTSQQKALNNILGIASKRTELNESAGKGAKVEKGTDNKRGSDHEETPVQRDLLFSAPIDSNNNIKISGLLIPIVKRNKVSVLVPRGRNRATFNYTSGNKFIPKEDTGKKKPLTGDKAVKQAQENGNGFLGAMPAAGTNGFQFINSIILFN